jgi:hypothetical protein
VKRIVGVALVGIAALLSGCGEESTAADEEQIRDVLTQATDATNAWDGDKMAALTCAKYREEARSFESVVPPMQVFSTAAEGAKEMGREQFADLIGAQFGGASQESLLAVADAVIGNDQTAYGPAMLDVMKQSMKFKLEKVANIVVADDDARADTTISFTVGSEPPQTSETKAKLVKEDGQWKDCTPPGE